MNYTWSLEASPSHSGVQRPAVSASPKQRASYSITQYSRAVVFHQQVPRFSSHRVVVHGQYPASHDNTLHQQAPVHSSVTQSLLVHQSHRARRHRKTYHTMFQAWTGHCAIVSWHRRPLRRPCGAPLVPSKFFYVCVTERNSIIAVALCLRPWS